MLCLSSYIHCCPCHSGHRKLGTKIVKCMCYEVTAVWQYRNVYITILSLLLLLLTPATVAGVKQWHLSDSVCLFVSLSVCTITQKRIIPKCSVLANFVGFAA